MYAQEYSFYRRPDTAGVTWMTPQQLDAARMNAVLKPVKVLEVKPQVRAESETFSDQSLLAAAPGLFRNAIRKGVAVIHREMPVEFINKGLKKFTLKHRRNMSAAAKRNHALKVSAESNHNTTT